MTDVSSDDVDVKSCFSEVVAVRSAGYCLTWFDSAYCSMRTEGNETYLTGVFVSDSKEEVCITSKRGRKGISATRAQSCCCTQT